MIGNATLPVAVVAATLAGTAIVYAAAGTAMPTTSLTSLTRSVQAPAKMAPSEESPMKTQKQMKMSRECQAGLGPYFDEASGALSARSMAAMCCRCVDRAS